MRSPYRVALFFTLLLVCHPAAAQSAATALPVLGFFENSTRSPLLTLIYQATDSIDLEIYEMSDLDVRQALRQALGRHVTIRVVQEPAPVGEHCNLFGKNKRSSADCLDLRALAQEVRDAGGDYVAFDKAHLCGIGRDVTGRETSSCFQHGKMMLVDGRYALISTGNFNSSNLCNLKYDPERCDRDFTFVTEDSDRVTLLQTIFDHDLTGERYDVAALMTAPLRAKVTVSPVALADLVAFIGSAHRSIALANQYLNEPAINDALIAAARRGVQVSVTVASVCSFGVPSQRKQTATAVTYQRFDAARISSRFFTRRQLIRGKPGYLHAKAIVVDGTRAWMGSINGSTESVYKNREFGIFFNEPHYVAALATQLQADHDDVNAETWEQSIRCYNDPR